LPPGLAAGVSELNIKNSLLEPVITARHRLPPPWRSILAFIAAENNPQDGNKTAQSGGVWRAAFLIRASGTRKPVSPQ
jgi:hypothetical protein